MVAFRVCRDISCPHPRLLDQHGVTVDDLIDWYAFYLWENDPDGKLSDVEEIEVLEQLKEEWGG